MKTFYITTVVTTGCAEVKTYQIKQILAKIKNN